jgi:hypothetical protein
MTAGKRTDAAEHPKEADGYMTNHELVKTQGQRKIDDRQRKIQDKTNMQIVMQAKTFGSEN